MRKCRCHVSGNSICSVQIFNYFIGHFWVSSFECVQSLTCTKSVLIWIAISKSLQRKAIIASSANNDGQCVFAHGFMHYVFFFRFVRLFVVVGVIIFIHLARNILKLTHLNWTLPKLNRTNSMASMDWRRMATIDALAVVRPQNFVVHGRPLLIGTPNPVNALLCQPQLRNNHWTQNKISQLRKIQFYSSMLCCAHVRNCRILFSFFLIRPEAHSEWIYYLTSTHLHHHNITFLIQ